MKKVLFKLLVLALPFCSLGQDIVLDNYLKEALANNLVIQQKNTSTEKALVALETAKSLYLPTLNFQGGYQSGAGGRSISFPVGDLLNPAYATLNKLTNSSNFPTLQNVDNNFLPSNFLDVKIVTSLPIYNTDLAFNKSIRTQQVALQKIDLDAYKKELVNQVKLTYFNFLTYSEASKIYQSALERAVEGKRIQEKLVENGKGLSAYIIRSESEIAQINASLAEVKRAILSTQFYFNFLLNVEQNREILYPHNRHALEVYARSFLIQVPDASRRDELKLLTASVELNSTILKMNQSAWVPKLNAFLNLGSQTSNWNLAGKAPYYFVGVQMDFPIYTAQQNRQKVKQSQLDVELSRQKLAYTDKQLNLAAQVAKQNLLASKSAHDAAEKQLLAAATYYKLSQKSYQEGVATYLESIDARTQLIIAELNLNHAKLKALIAASNFERELGVYPIN